MLAEMIDRIVELSNAQHEFKELDLPGGREKLVQMPGGKVERVPIPPPHRAHLTGCLESFSQIMQTATGNDPPAVFVAESSSGRVDVIGIHDFGDRRDTTTLRVQLSSAIEAIGQLRGACTQKYVVSLLRDSIVDSIDPGLLTLFRDLDFTRRHDDKATIEHGREWLGKSVEAMVRSDHGDLPEQIAVDLRIFSGAQFLGCRRKVEFSIEIDPANQRISFIPRGDQLREAIEHGRIWLANLVRGELGDETLVVLGTP